MFNVSYVSSIRAFACLTVQSHKGLQSQNHTCKQRTSQTRPLITSRASTSKSDTLSLFWRTGCSALTLTASLLHFTFTLQAQHFTLGKPCETPNQPKWPVVFDFEEALLLHQGCGFAFSGVPLKNPASQTIRRSYHRYTTSAW